MYCDRFLQLLQELNLQLNCSIAAIHKAVLVIFTACVTVCDVCSLFSILSFIVLIIIYFRSCSCMPISSYFCEYSLPWACCIPRPVATGRVSCVCDWLSDATSLDSGDRYWICNAVLDKRILSALVVKP